MASEWRSVVREPEFEDQLAALIPFEPWRDDYLAPAEDLLARSPDVGEKVESPVGTVWMLMMSPVNDRTVVLYYTFDSCTVILAWIVAFDA